MLTHVRPIVAYAAFGHAVTPPVLQGDLLGELGVAVGGWVQQAQQELGQLQQGLGGVVQQAGDAIKAGKIVSQAALQIRTLILYFRVSMSYISVCIMSCLPALFVCILCCCCIVTLIVYYSCVVFCFLFCV